MTAIGRQEVVTYLRRLADLPEGVKHRTWLFHAAHMLNRDVTTIFVCSMCAKPMAAPSAVIEREGESL